MAIKIDAFGACLNQHGEEICGDQVKVFQNELSVTAMLVNGVGGGVKANLLTSFAVKMVSALLKEGESIGEIANTIVESQPSGKRQDGINYFTFTLIQALFSGAIYIEQLEAPDVILLLRGKPFLIDMNQRILHGKTIRSGACSIKQADTIIAVGSGILNAGTDRDLRNGWNLETISAYMMNAYNPRATAQDLAQLLTTAGDSLSYGRPKDDLSALVFRMKG